MRGLRFAMAVLLALAASPAAAKRSAQPAFAEPGDIIAAEGNFTHLGVAKGLKGAIRATAAPDAQILAPRLMRVADYANSADPSVQWHTSQLWMSCDGSIAVTHGAWQKGAGTGWYITVWQRQKGGSYKWVLAQGGTPQPPASDSDMIAASVADCPVRRAHGSGDTPAPVHGPAAGIDHLSGAADDATLEWTTTLAPDGGRTFTLQTRQDGVLREVLRATAAAPGN